MLPDMEMNGLASFGAVITMKRLWFFNFKIRIFNEEKICTDMNGTEP